MIRRLLAVLAAAITTVSIYHMFRLRLPANLRRPRPTADYAEALERFDQLQAKDGERVTPVCRSLLLAHGQPTKQVIVLFHGFTNCPYQFLDLGKELYAAGWTVLIPRFSHHGLEPMSNDLRNLSVEDLIDLADEAVDIASGLGERVTVCGLSLGGALSMWVAQNRPEVDRVVALSPALSVDFVPTGFRRAFSNLFGLAPNFFLWWDPAVREPLPGREHQYPRLASRGVATILRLGQIVAFQAKQTKPAARSILLVNNPADEVVDLDFAASVMSSWREHQADAQTHNLPAGFGFPHDYIDPTQPDQQVDNAYPLILEILGADDSAG